MRISDWSSDVCSSDLAILPGVVQVDCAIHHARRCFDIPANFHRIEALKFFHVLPAGARVRLELEFEAEKSRLGFCYRVGEVTHSSGRIRFELRGLACGPASLFRFSLIAKEPASDRKCAGWGKRG